MTEIIRASSLAYQMDEDKIRKFNDKVLEANSEGDRKIYLYFDEWGFDWEDVQFVQDAGYELSRNRACLWWEVKW